MDQDPQNNIGPSLQFTLKRFFLIFRCNCSPNHALPRNHVSVSVLSSGGVRDPFWRFLRSVAHCSTTRHNPILISSSHIASVVVGNSDMIQF
ncbi:hypothetical protein L1887_14702 [Cichorium endivia]|nr:hypothetical protein L1887_14702 [Cichorium endivia]